MIQRLTEDRGGNRAIELDLQGIEFLISGLTELSESDVGWVLFTPAIWSEPSPWWKFWSNKEEPKVGEFCLKRIASNSLVIVKPTTKE